jgi:hypothetical protein
MASHYRTQVTLPFERTLDSLVFLRIEKTIRREAGRKTCERHGVRVSRSCVSLPEQAPRIQMDSEGMVVRWVSAAIQDADDDAVMKQFS